MAKMDPIEIKVNIIAEENVLDRIADWRADSERFHKAFVACGVTMEDGWGSEMICGFPLEEEIHHPAHGHEFVPYKFVEYPEFWDEVGFNWNEYVEEYQSSLPD